MHNVLSFFTPCEIVDVANCYPKIGDNLQKEKTAWYDLRGTKVQDVTLMFNGNLLGAFHTVTICFFYSKL